MREEKKMRELGLPGSSHRIYAHASREVTFRKIAEGTKEGIKLLEKRKEIRKEVLRWLMQSGLYIEIMGGYDEDSAVRINATQLQVEADRTIKTGETTAGYWNTTPVLNVDGYDLAPICDGFNIQVNRKGQHPLIIVPKLHPASIIIDQDK